MMGIDYEYIYSAENQIAEILKGVEKKLDMKIESICLRDVEISKIGDEDPVIHREVNIELVKNKIFIWRV